MYWPAGLLSPLFHKITVYEKAKTLAKFHSSIHPHYIFPVPLLIPLKRVQLDAFHCLRAILDTLGSLDTIPPGEKKQTKADQTCLISAHFT